MQMKKQKSQSTRRWYDCDGEDHGEVANAWFSLGNFIACNSLHFKVLEETGEDL
jgi:hypothetical protein